MDKADCEMIGTCEELIGLVLSFLPTTQKVLLRNVTVILLCRKSSRYQSQRRGILCLCQLFKLTVTETEKTESDNTIEK